MRHSRDGTGCHNGSMGTTSGTNRHEAGALPYVVGFTLAVVAAAFSAAQSLRPEASFYERALAAVTGFVAVRLYLTKPELLSYGARAFAVGLRRVVGPLAASVAMGSLVAAVVFPVTTDRVDAAAVGPDWQASRRAPAEGRITLRYHPERPQPAGPSRPRERSVTPVAWSESRDGGGGRWVLFANGEVREVGRREWDRVRPRE